MNISVESEWGDLTFLFSDDLRLNGYPSPTFDFLCSADWDYIAQIVIDNQETIRRIYCDFGNQRIDLDGFRRQLLSVFPANLFSHYGRDFDELLIFILESDEFAPLVGEGLSLLRQEGGDDVCSFVDNPQDEIISPKCIASAVSFLECNVELNKEGIYSFSVKPQNAPLLFIGKSFRLVSAEQTLVSGASIMVQLLNYVVGYLMRSEGFMNYVEAHPEYFEHSRATTRFEARRYVLYLLISLQRVTPTWGTLTKSADEESFTAYLFELRLILDKWVADEARVESEKVDTILWMKQLCNDVLWRVSYFSFHKNEHGPVCQLQADAISSIRQSRTWTYELTSIVELLFLMTSLSGRITPANTSFLRPCACCKKPVLSSQENPFCMRVFMDPKTKKERKDRASCERVFTEKKEKEREAELSEGFHKENKQAIIKKHRQYNDSYRRKLNSLDAHLQHEDKSAEYLRETLLEYAYLCLYGEFFGAVYEVLIANDFFPPATAKDGVGANFEDWHRKMASFKKNDCRAVLSSYAGNRPKLPFRLISPDSLSNESSGDAERYIWGCSSFGAIWPEGIFDILLQCTERKISEDDAKDFKRAIKNIARETIFSSGEIDAYSKDIIGIKNGEKQLQLQHKRR